MFKLCGRPGKPFLFHYTKMLEKHEEERKQREESKTKTPTEGYGISGRGNNFFFFFVHSAHPLSGKTHSLCLAHHSMFLLTLLPYVYQE